MGAWYRPYWVWFWKSSVCFPHAMFSKNPIGIHSEWDCYKLASACVAKLPSTASCSWWWLCYMSKRIIWTSARVVRPTSIESCSWWCLCYMSTCIIWTSTCVAKLTSSVSCSWWWLCWNVLESLWSPFGISKKIEHFFGCGPCWLCFCLDRVLKKQFLKVLCSFF